MKLQVKLSFKKKKKTKLLFLIKKNFKANLPFKNGKLSSRYTFIS